MPLPSVLTLSGISRAWSAEQPLNAPNLISVTVEGMLTPVREEQFWNAFASITLTPSEMTTLTRPELSNAPSYEVRPAGKVISVSMGQSANASEPIVLSPEGRLTLPSFEHI